MKTRLGRKSDPIARVMVDKDQSILVPPGTVAACRPPQKPDLPAPAAPPADDLILAAIEDALTRLEGGTYGLCRSCGEEISLPRLDANPVTTTCAKCGHS